MALTSPQVIDAMQPWKCDSQFGDFIAEKCTFPTALPSPIPGEMNFQPQKKDLDSLEQAYVQLQKVERYFEEGEQTFKDAIQQLRLFIQRVREVSPHHTAAQRFEMLDPLRAWLFWRPVMLLKQFRASPSALMTVAYYYTIALVVEPLFPEIGAAYFGSLSLSPIEEIARQFYCTSPLQATENSGSTILRLMKYPIDMVSIFRVRMGWFQSKIPMSLTIPEKIKSNPFKIHSITESPPIYDTLFFNCGQKHTQNISPEPQSTLSLEPDSQYYCTNLEIPSPYFHRGGCHTPDLSYFSDEPSFLGEEEIDDFAMYDSDRNTSSSSSSNEFLIPTAAVWM